MWITTCASIAANQPTAHILWVSSGVLSEFGPLIYTHPSQLGSTLVMGKGQRRLEAIMFFARIASKDAKLNHTAAYIEFGTNE